MPSFLDIDTAVDRASHTTASTVVSADFFSDHTGSTALTTPDLTSPSNPWAKRLSHHSLENIAEALETRPLGLSPPPPASLFDEDRHPLGDSGSSGSHYSDDEEYAYNDDKPAGLVPAPEDVRRGPSVRSRASMFEVAPNVARSTGHGLTLSIPPADNDRPRSASPRLRLPPSPQQSDFLLSPADDAAPRRGLPFPPGSPNASQGYTARLPHSEPPRRPPLTTGGASLSRDGSASRIIAQWETETSGRPLPTPTPSDMHRGSPSPRPPPSPVPSNGSMPWQTSRLPQGGISLPAPLLGSQGSRGAQSDYNSNGSMYGSMNGMSLAAPPDHGQNSSRAPSPLSWSPTSPSRKRKSLSPMPGASPTKISPRKLGFKRSPFKGLAGIADAVGGAVKGFRKGHKEAEDPRPRTFISLDDDTDWFSQPQTVNDTSGSLGFAHYEEPKWTPAKDAIRTSPMLYLARSSHGQAWNTTWATLNPRSLVIMNAPAQGKGGSPMSRIGRGLATPYSSIPHPDNGAPPLAELSMFSCTEVRAIRKDELRGRGIPPAPEGVGTEVLELSFMNGSVEYVGVEGVAGRMSWITAIWDVIGASKQGTAPPESPSMSSLRNVLNPLPLPQGWHDAPVQKVGDTWVKAGDFIGESSSLQGSQPCTPDLNAGSGGFNPAARFPSIDDLDEAEANKTLQPDARMDVDMPQSARETDLPRPLCTLPLTVHKRSAPPTPEDVPPPLPPKKSVGSVVQDRMRAWNSPRQQQQPPTPLKSVTNPAPATPDLHRPVALRAPRTEPQGLREALVSIFDAEGEHNYPASEETKRQMRSKAMEDRIRAWQPKPDETPAPLSRSATTRTLAATQLSFNPSDLNPSRSASQIRRDPYALTEEDLAGLGLGAIGAPRLPPVTRKAPPKLDVPSPQPTPILPDVPSVDPLSVKSESLSASSTGPKGPRGPSPRGPSPMPSNVKTIPGGIASMSPALRQFAAQEATPNASPVPASSPTPRINRRVLAAAAIFEPAIADRAKDKEEQSSMSERKPMAKAVESAPATPAKGLKADGTPSKVGLLAQTFSPPKSTTSQATKLSTPSRAPLTPSKRVVSAKRSVSSKTSMSAKRAALTPAKKDVVLPDTMSPKPYAAARLALRSTAGSAVDKPGEKLVEKPQEKRLEKSAPKSRALVDKPLPKGALYVVNKTPSPEEMAISKFPDNPVVASSEVESTTRSIIASPSVLGWKSLASVTDMDAEDKTTLGVPLASIREASVVSRPTSFIEQNASRDLAAVPLTAVDPSVIQKLDTHSADHHQLSRQVEGVSADVTNVAVGLASLTTLFTDHNRTQPKDLTERLDALGSNVRDMHEAVQALPATNATPQEIATRLEALGTDVRGVHEAVQESTAQIAALAAVEPGADKLPEVHAKLDAIAHLIQEVLTRQSDLAGVTAAAAGAGAAVVADKAEPEAEKEPKAAASELATAAQISEVQSALKELDAARGMQTQQTAEIARYLADLNGWLEKFVQNSGTELEKVSSKINNLVGDAAEGETPTGLVAEMHSMLAEQNQQVNAAAVQAQRLDSLLGYMGQDRERNSAQHGMIEQLLSASNQQREDTASMLQAIAVDLTNEIKGERVRFIDSMHDATSMNMQIHVDEFKTALSQEVQRSIRELGQMREQKKVLEHQIADLFALKAKHGDERYAQPQQQAQAPQQLPPRSPGGRLLPMPPM